MNNPASLAISWTTPAEIEAKLLRLWKQGRLLSAPLNDAVLFPLTMSVRQPEANAVMHRFDEVRCWIRLLEKGSKAVRGYGYEIEWQDFNHRQLGRNRIPAKVILPTAADALRLLGRQRDAARFAQLAALTLDAFPELKEWLSRRALIVLESAEIWERVLAILDWFRHHPKPGIYLRQLDIAGIDTKFIETRKGLLTELLDQILPASALEPSATGARHFELRYGLLSKPSLIRFRMLDQSERIGGLSDISVPLCEFAALNPNVKRIFITENEINGLAFPELPHSMMIFGGGYNIGRLANIGWLAHRDITYWGDIDTHGYAILDRLRAAYPHVKSLLMDRATLLAHRALWGAEEQDKRYCGQLNRLTEPEQALFEDLRSNRLGERVRMEQEQLSFGWVAQAIRSLEN